MASSSSAAGGKDGWDTAKCERLEGRMAGISLNVGSGVTGSFAGSDDGSVGQRFHPLGTGVVSALS